MKKLFPRFLLTSVFATSFLLAQPPGPRGTPPDPATMAQHRVSFLTTALTLTTAQQQQATTIFTNSALADSTVHDNLKTAHQSLSDAVKNNDTAAIDRVSATIGNLTAQLTSNDAKANAALYQILTPDQQTKLTQLHDRGPGGGGFGGRRGGPQGLSEGRR
jgi:Spy/CpxP family protein refolding chaperone